MGKNTAEIAAAMGQMTATATSNKQTFPNGWHIVDSPFFKNSIWYGLVRMYLRNFDQ